MHYNRFRYYDPLSGQYTQQDPIGLAGGTPLLSQYVDDPAGWIDPLGLQRDCSGVAIVRQYKNGYREGHFTVEVRHGDLNYSSHQVTRNGGSETTIARSGSYNSSNTSNLVHEAEIPLPNAKAAIDYQKTIINESLGKYDATKNSCLTHVCDVLRAGSGPSYSSSKLGLAKFFKKNGFGLLESNKSIL